MKKILKEKVIYFLVAAGIILLLVLDIFSKPLIDYYKAKNDPIRLATIDANKQLKGVRDLLILEMDSLVNASPTIQVFTNDFHELEAELMPDVDLYVNPYAPSFSNRQGQAEEIGQFLESSDTIGYDVIIINPRGRYICSKVFADYFPKYKNKYKLVVSYKRMVMDIEKYASIDSLRQIMQGGKKQEYQLESANFSKEELFLGEMEDNLKQLMLPVFDKDNPTYYFYFCAYDQTTSQADFLEMAEAFKAMFLKDYDCSNCTLRTIGFRK